MATQHVDDEEAPTITETEFSFVVSIREARNAEESLTSIRTAFETAVGLVELSERGRVN